MTQGVYSWVSYRYKSKHKNMLWETVLVVFLNEFKKLLRCYLNSGLRVCLIGGQYDSEYKQTAPG